MIILVDAFRGMHTSMIVGKNLGLPTAEKIVDRVTLAEYQKQQQVPIK